MWHSSKNLSLVCGVLQYRASEGDFSVVDGISLLPLFNTVFRRSSPDLLMYCGVLEYIPPLRVILFCGGIVWYSCPVNCVCGRFSRLSVFAGKKVLNYFALKEWSSLVYFYCFVIDLRWYQGARGKDHVFGTAWESLPLERCVTISVVQRRCLTGSRLLSCCSLWCAWLGMKTTRKPMRLKPEQIVWMICSCSAFSWGC